MKLNTLTLAALFLTVNLGVAQAEVSCEEVRDHISQAFYDDNRVPLEWEPTQTYSGFTNTNFASYIKTAISCGNSGEFTGLGVSFFDDDNDDTLKAPFARGMLTAIDATLAPGKADALMKKARRDLARNLKQRTYGYGGSAGFTLIGFTIQVEKTAIALRYDIKRAKRGGGRS